MGWNGLVSRLGLVALTLATGCQYFGQHLHGLVVVAYTANPPQVLADGVDAATVQVRRSVRQPEAARALSFLVILVVRISRFGQRCLGLVAG